VQTLGLDAQSLEYLKGTLMNYVRQNYGGGAEKADTAHIQNKLSQLLTYLFAGLYASSWPSFFDDFLSLAKNGAANETMSGSILFFRLLGSIHDEIADVIITRSPEDAKRNVILKDLIRDRDAQKVAIFWQEILSKWRQIDLTVVEMCLKTISRWVSWVDISLVVNQPILDALLEMAGQQDLGSTSSNEIKVRDGAIDTFTEITSKKMRPAEKMELIKVLNLATVVGQLITSPALEQSRNTPKYDTDLAEAVAKLVNNIVRDCILVLNAPDADNPTKQQADEILQIFLPYLLRFFSDEYDEICSTVIDSLSELLVFFRRAGNGRAPVPFPSHYTSMLGPILTAIVAKMKYDETATWGDEDDEADEAEFIDLRKKLNILQQQVAAIDEPLFIAAISALVSETFGKVYSNQQQLDWRELDLALYEVYLFGDLAAKYKGLYQKQQPSSPAAQTLVVLLEQMVQSSKCDWRLFDSLNNRIRYWQLRPPSNSAAIHGDMRPI
jgi:exportin-T